MDTVAVGLVVAVVCILTVADIVHLTDPSVGEKVVAAAAVVAVFANLAGCLPDFHGRFTKN